ncbi:MAG: EI24 domain-containing protein [Verrucomicrobiota bacterium]
MPPLILKSAAKALAQFLSDPRLWLILLLSAALSALCLGGLFTGVWWGVREGVAWIAGHWPKYAGWLKWTEGTLGFITAAVVSFLLFPTIFGIVASFFQEAVADVVEARYYPHLPKADGAALLASLWAAVRFFVLMITVNLIALPFYLMLLWLAGSGVALMLAVNGLLAGREYYEVVALRRLTPREMDASRRGNRTAYFLTGLGIAALALVPVVNLLVPVFGIAVMVHVFHGRRPAAADTVRSGSR